MATPNLEPSRGRVVLLEPNAALRSAIVTLLRAETYSVEVTDTFEHVRELATRADNSVVLVAWQSMEGLLAEGRRASLVALTRHLRLVVMVPRAWARLLEHTDLAAAVTQLIAKPFEADELLARLDAALATEVEPAEARAPSQRPRSV